MKVLRINMKMRTAIAVLFTPIPRNKRNAVVRDILNFVTDLFMYALYLIRARSLNICGDKLT